MQKQAENEYNTVTLSNTVISFLQNYLGIGVKSTLGIPNISHLMPLDMTCSMTKLPTNRESKQAQFRVSSAVTERMLVAG